MEHLISFSGGKDSTALILWAKENLESFEVIFADTGWEHPITYEYINYINQTLCDGKMIVVKSKKYDGFSDMSVKKQRVPSTKARFCTQELKLFPIHDYIHDRWTIEQLGNITMYDGRRADESFSRSKLAETVFDMDYYGCWIRRPLIKWTAQDCFDIMKRHGIEPNPLYKMGMKRVGCMPCIMSTLPEIEQISKRFPEIINKVRELENKIGRTFFGVEKIPFQHRKTSLEDGNRVAFIDNIVNYVSDDKNQTVLFDEEPQSCMSHYSICE